MKLHTTRLKEVLLLEPQVFTDSRGHFFESFNQQTFSQLTGLERSFVQDNQSLSSRHVLRGLHYQIEHAQGKLVRVLEGEIFDVAVDLRRNSETFGQWVGFYLSATNRLQAWIPEGFAHGFLVTSERAVVHYKTTDFYAPQHERSVRWDDPQLAIEWPLDDQQPHLSDKDAKAPSLSAAEYFA